MHVEKEKQEKNVFVWCMSSPLLSQLMFHLVRALLNREQHSHSVQALWGFVVQENGDRASLSRRMEIGATEKDGLQNRCGAPLL